MFDVKNRRIAQRLPPPIKLAVVAMCILYIPVYLALCLLLCAVQLLGLSRLGDYLFEWVSLPLRFGEAVIKEFHR